MNNAFQALVICLALILAANGIANPVSAAEAAWTDIPRAHWKGATAVEVPALGHTAAAVIALPTAEAKALIAATAQAQPPGLYEVRLALRPSHTAGAIAFHSGLRAKLGETVAGTFEGQFFARPHEPEIRTFQVVKTGTGALALALEAYADAGVADSAWTKSMLKKGGPTLGGDAGDLFDGANDMELDLELEVSLTPDTAVYYLVDKVEFRLLSRSGRVTRVTTDKIRYLPGGTLKGTATVADIGRSTGSDQGGQGGGTLNLYLEHGVKDRAKVKSLPVDLRRGTGFQPVAQAGAAARQEATAGTHAPEHSSMRGRLAVSRHGSQTLSFEIALPEEELGYALVAEFVSADGADRSEAAEYFTIAENFQRVALFGGNAGSTRDVTLDEEPIRKALAATRAEYYNTVEYFAWAMDDLLELTPDEDCWFSGQTNYRMNKPTIQRQIRLAHEQGVAMVTYGKWCVSGAPGWEAVYDRPWDFSGTYRQPIGSWDSHNAWIFDLRRNGEQVPYSPRPGGGEGWFDPWWNEFIGIGPNASLSMIKSAAEEMAASAEMFGWDAVRWDGHIRAGWNATGRSGQYQPWAARQTQSLMRYFKDIMEQKHPGFRHGYNYFLIEPNKGYDWAKEDFELDELCRGGGLLMNESIGNASAGYTFDQIARTLQVEGDLCRERGGFYLGISFGMSPRDSLIESALWAAAGCRPYSSNMTRETRRYLTRYAHYTLDERLRRLATPEKILTPSAETKLWWQPFVYETPLENGRRQLVVNLLNIPREDKRPNNRAAPLPKPEWDMPAGTDPVMFALTLPPGLTAEGGHLIDPWTLDVQPLPIRDGRFEAPAVAIWRVLVLDLAVAKNAPSLAELNGPPKTLGVKRGTLKDQRLPEVTVDSDREVWEVNKSLQPLEPDWAAKQRQEREAFDAMTPTERIETLKKRRDANTVESLSAHWWKGGVLPNDLKRKDQKADYGDLSPERNGRVDIFYGRGAMDHRLRMQEAMAGLDRFQVHDAPFGGSFRGGGLGNMWLGNNVPWRRFPEFDLLLYTGIPYAAIGIENCYALPEYVRAGGAVFFTGGEWAFGKGGYLKTVLERDLLPVLCTAMDDCRTSETPIGMTPGKDFAELGCPANFAAKPSFWVYNQVLLKDDPGVRVFLTSDRGPVLVGWQLGKGRVACLLVDYRGKSTEEVTAFFDWHDWPRVATAVMQWLAPEGRAVETKRTAVSAAEAKKLMDGLEGDAMESLLDDSNDDLTMGLTGSPTGRAPTKGRKASVATLRRLLKAPVEAVDTAVLLDQLLAPGELPDDMRWGLADAVRARPPATLAERVTSALAHSDASARQNAIQLLGMVDGAALGREMGSAGPAMQTDARGRTYALTLALPLVKTPDLVDEGKRRVSEWNASEKAVLDKWTGGKGFSPATPELPGLDAMSLFQRLAWLAYLTRHEPKTYGAQLVREWLKTGVYQEYCGRTKATYAQVGKKSGDWDRLSACLGRLRDLTRQDVEALVKTAPDTFAEGLCGAHFTREILAARNLLGNLDPVATAGILEKLKTARHPDLAAFAAARAAAPNPEP